MYQIVRGVRRTAPFTLPEDCEMTAAFTFTVSPDPALPLPSTVSCAPARRKIVTEWGRSEAQVGGTWVEKGGVRRKRRGVRVGGAMEVLRVGGTWGEAGGVLKKMGGA